MSELSESPATPEEDTSNIGGLLDILSRLRDAESSGVSDVNVPCIGSDTPADGESEMDADGYHNRAVREARLGNLRQAVLTCKKGLAFYPNNADLLADTIKYSADNGDLKTAGEYYTLLCERVPRNRFNWRAFTFSFDFLMLDVDSKEDECRALLADYAKYLPFEEKRYMAESELEAAVGNHQRAMDILTETVERIANAAQCALHLADMQMKRGMFEETIKTCDYGLSASAETQPSINIAYLYYVRALAQDALLHRRNFDDPSASKDCIHRLSSEYQAMLKSFPILQRYKDNIETRIKMLDMLELHVV